MDVVTPSLHLTAGIRYTHEQKNFQLIQTVIAGIRRPIGSLLVADTSEKHRSFDQTSPRVTLAYDIASTTMVYATYSRGLKSGGFKGLNSDGCGPYRLDTCVVAGRYGPILN